MRVTGILSMLKRKACLKALAAQGSPPPPLPPPPLAARGPSPPPPHAAAATANLRGVINASCSRDLLVRKLASACRPNVTFGCTADDNNMWVSGGCYGSWKARGAAEMLHCGRRYFRRVDAAARRHTCSIIWTVSTVPTQVEELASRVLGSTDVLPRSEIALLSLHGKSIELHAARGDYMLPRLADEFRHPARYRMDSLGGRDAASARPADGEGVDVVVDVGCNLGDFSIAAWKQNPRLHILCLEPMPVTYVFLRWNLLANRVPLLSAQSFGAPHARRGGVLALQSAVTADGREVVVEYSPLMSGFGVTSASAERGVLGSFVLPATRSGVHANTTRATVGSLELDRFLKARGVRRLRMLKMDCEGCEHEVIPRMRDLLRRTATFTGELHHCQAQLNHSCTYSLGRIKQTVKTLCQAGHPCEQCTCVKSSTGANVPQLGVFCC